MSTTDPTPVTETADRSAYLADHLAPTPRNLASATQAIATIAAGGWEPLTGYPGSDTLWQVRCLLCDWEGLRFYSHLRRGRPVFRHDGCLPQAEHADKLAELTKQAPAQCHCLFAHPTTPEKAVEVLQAIAYARQVDDGPALLIGLTQLLGPCPASAARAAALAEANS